MKDLKEVYVFVARPAYAYREDKGPYSGQMLETHLNKEFLADSYGDAVRAAIAWANERLESYMKDAYPGAFLSSIKVSTKVIGRARPDGQIETRGLGTYFEWKYDWPGTLEEFSIEWVNGANSVSRRHPSDPQ